MNVFGDNQQLASRHYWWIIALRGILAIIFGLIAILFPFHALVGLIYFIGAYALVDGIFAVVVALRERTVVRRWWILLLEGIAGIIIGLGILFSPTFAFAFALTILYLIAFWAIFTGVMEISAAFTHGRRFTHEWTLALAGALSILFGILLIILQFSGLLSLVWLIGIYALAFGIMLVIRAFQFRSGNTSLLRPAL